MRVRVSPQALCNVRRHSTAAALPSLMDSAPIERSLCQPRSELLPDSSRIRLGDPAPPCLSSLAWWLAIASFMLSRHPDAK